MLPRVLKLLPPGNSSTPPFDQSPCCDDKAHDVTWLAFLVPEHLNAPTSASPLHGRIVTLEENFRSRLNAQHPSALSPVAKQRNELGKWSFAASSSATRSSYSILNARGCVHFKSRPTNPAILFIGRVYQQSGCSATPDEVSRRPRLSSESHHPSGSEIPAHLHPHKVDARRRRAAAIVQPVPRDIAITCIVVLAQRA